MTTKWRPHFDPDNLYFVTTTAARHKCIFQRDDIKRILVDALYYVSLMNQAKLYAFVVMPNHFHAIVQCVQTHPLKDWVRAFKTSTSQLIVRYHRVRQDDEMLAILASLVTNPKRYRYKVWEDGYLAKAVFSPDFLRQKLEYIHNNPLQPHWNLTDAPEAYPWSSARSYLTGEPGIIPVTDVWDEG